MRIWITPSEGAAPSMAGEKLRWWADPQALRKAAEGFVFAGLVLIFGYYGSALYFRTTESAHRKMCCDNLRSLASFLTMYAQDYDGRYPPQDAELGRALFKGAGVEARYLICPSDDLASPSPRKRRARVPISYSYQEPGSNPDTAANAPLLWDRNGGVSTGAHRLGGNVLYLQGNVRWRPSDYWSASDQPW